MLLPFALFWFSAGHWLLWVYAPILLRSNGLGDTQVGDLAAMHTLASALALLPIGWITDRWSPRGVATAGSVALVSGAALVALAASGGRDHGYPAGFILLGVGQALTLVALYALFYKRVEQASAGARYGSLLSASLMGYALGPLLGSLLADRGLGVVAGASAAVFVALGALAMRLPRTEPLPIRLGEYTADLKRPGPLFLLLVIVVTSSHSAVEIVGLPLVAADAAGLGTHGLGLFYGVIGLWTAFLTPRIGRWFDRSPRPVLVLAVGVALSGVFQGCTGLAWSFGSLVGIRLFHTVGDCLFLVLIGVLTHLVFPRARVGGLFALTQFVRAATVAAASIASGRVNARYGVAASFASSGTTLLAAGLLVAAFRGAIRPWVGLPRHPTGPLPPPPPSWSEDHP